MSQQCFYQMASWQSGGFTYCWPFFSWQTAAAGWPRTRWPRSSTSSRTTSAFNASINPTVGLVGHWNVWLVFSFSNGWAVLIFVRYTVAPTTVKTSTLCRLAFLCILISFWRVRWRDRDINPVSFTHDGCLHVRLSIKLIFSHSFC